MFERALPSIVQRLFTSTYGRSPSAHLSQRRVERAQDLLRATNLTVTEVCHAVGYSSLGSFSARFKEIVGESPSQFQRRYAARGNPRIPGCHVFMSGLVLFAITFLLNVIALTVVRKYREAYE